MPDLSDFDPFRLSRRLGVCAARVESFERALAVGPGLFDPFGGEEFPGKTAFEQAASLGEGDPMVKGLLRWTQRLAETRINLPWIRAEADLNYREPHPIRSPFEAVLSLSEIRRRALGAPRDQAQLWWSNFERLEQKLSDLRMGMWERRREIRVRLGNEEPSAFFPCLESEAQISGDELIATLATWVLEKTSDAAGSLWSPGWAAHVEVSSAFGASEGWPARLAPDTLRQLFGEQQLFRGVTLSPGRLPERLCPMSFPRAAMAVGRALCSELRPKDLPFVVSRDPDDLVGHEMGALFLLWSTSPAFLRRVLGVSRAELPRAERSFSRALVAILRLSAARVLIGFAAFRSRGQLCQEFPRISQQLLGRELRAQSALGRFSVGVDVAARFVALLSALAREEALCQEYDEDWYRNPRAQERFRDELSLPASTSRDASECKRGLRQLLDRLT